MNKKIPFSVSLVVPVYNSKNVVTKQLNICSKILSSICKDYEIVISDDCSNDGITEALKKTYGKSKKVRVFFQNKNLGIGKNFKFLYKSAKKDYVMTFAADGDFEPQDIKRMLLFCAEKKADLVIGRRIKKGGYTFYRKVISLSFRLLPLLFFGINTVDAGSIKIIKRDAFLRHLISESVFVEAEIIIRAKRKGYKILSYPIFYGKPEKISGAAGKLSLARDAFFDLLRFRFTL